MSYFEYYEQSRTHLSLDKDASLTRAVQPPTMGRVLELPQLEDFTTDTNDGQLEQSFLLIMRTQKYIHRPRRGDTLLREADTARRSPTRRFNKCFLRPRNLFSSSAALLRMNRSRGRVAELGRNRVGLVEQEARTMRVMLSGQTNAERGTAVAHLTWARLRIGWPTVNS